MNLTEIIETVRAGCQAASKAEVLAAFKEQKAIASDLAYGTQERELAKRLAKFLNQELRNF